MMSILYVILTVVLLDVVSCEKEMIEFTLANTPEEARMDFVAFARSCGREAVVHYVVTEDGYILEVYNLPGDMKKPILFNHGVFDSSDGWILRRNTSLTLMMEARGFDVWLVNFRGNRYSRNHTTLNPDKDSKYWDYSPHELGYFDLPACIDYVLKQTGQKKLTLIGFSEGTTAAFILGSTRPEYNEKVNLFIALAPIVFLEHVRAALSTIINVSPVFNFLISPFVDEVAGYYSMSKALLNILCTQPSIGYELCYLGGLNAVSGNDPYSVDKMFFKIIMGHFPAGSSRKNLIHYSQISLRKAFAQYDYGAAKNQIVYGSETPPVYDVSKVTMNVMLVSGKNDPVSTLKDVEKLKPLLPNLVAHVVLENPLHNHLDHLWAEDAYKTEYPAVMDMVDKFN